MCVCTPQFICQISAHTTIWHRRIPYICTCCCIPLASGIFGREDMVGFIRKYFFLRTDSDIDGRFWDGGGCPFQQKRDVQSAFWNKSGNPEIVGQDEFFRQRRAAFGAEDYRRYVILKCSSCLLISNRCLNEYQNIGGVR